MSLIQQAKRCLHWKQERLIKTSHIDLEELDTFFCNPLEVLANERHYHVSHQEYLTFLNQFKSNIISLSHHVNEYYEIDNTVIMPMQATVENDEGNITHFEAVKFFSYNDDHKITRWKEVAVEISTQQRP